MTRSACPAAQVRRSGFTLIEVLIATVITLMLVMSVSALLGYFATHVSDSRGLTSLNDQLRNVKQLLQSDLAGITAHTSPPPLDPDRNDGYLEIIEGPIGPVFLPISTSDPEMMKDQRLNFPVEVTPFLEAKMQEFPNAFDATFDDVDDVIMFTSLNLEKDFVGSSGLHPSDRGRTAEIIWFMRGKTLYRRVLVLQPRAYLGTATQGNLYTRDISARVEGRRNVGSMARGSTAYLVGNSLGDLTKRENRFAHQPLAFPYDSRTWGTVVQRNGPSSVVFGRPGPNMPTLAESLSGLPFPNYNFLGPTIQTQHPNIANPPVPIYIQPAPILGTLDFSNQRRTPRLELSVTPDNGPLLAYDPWSETPLNIPNAAPIQVGGINVPMLSVPSNALTLQVTNIPREQMAGYQGRARYDDIVMTNVLSFDVKVWDPGAPILVVSGGATGTRTLLPGDWLYRNALRQWITSPLNGNVQVVGFGAYVDLNYMWGSGFRDPYHFKVMNPGWPWLPADDSALYTTTYETALRQYESQILSSPVGVTLPRPKFSGPGNAQSGLQGIIGRPSSFSGDMASWLAQCYANPQVPGGVFSCIYDTWSIHYEKDGVDQGGTGDGQSFADRWPAPDGIVDNAFNGVDDDGVNGIDDPGERETLPPYMHPLRGIQVRIRAYEPDSKQIREFTVTHEFLQE